LFKFLSRDAMLVRICNDYDRTGDSSLLTPKISSNFQRRHPQRKRQIEIGYGLQSTTFDPSRYISETVQDRDVVTMER